MDNERHPENIDPQWFQELVRRAFDREVKRQQEAGLDPDSALEIAMWHVFKLRENLSNLYQEGKADGYETI